MLETWFTCRTTLATYLTTFTSNRSHPNSSSKALHSPLLTPLSSWLARTHLFSSSMSKTLVLAKKSRSLSNSHLLVAQNQCLSSRERTYLRAWGVKTQQEGHSKMIVDLSVFCLEKGHRKDRQGWKIPCSRTSPWILTWTTRWWGVSRGATTATTQVKFKREEIHSNPKSRPAADLLMRMVVLEQPHHLPISLRLVSQIESRAMPLLIKLQG